VRVKKRNGRLADFNAEKINKFVERACRGLDDVSASEIIIDAEISFRDKIPTTEIDKTLELTARSKVYKEPNYSYVAARIVLTSLYKEVLKASVDGDTFDSEYRNVFIRNIKRGVKEGLFHLDMVKKFDLLELSDYLNLNRDGIFKYVGIRNIYDRYLAKIGNSVIETPQAFYMRVAMGLCLQEDDPTERAKELYDLYSQHRASPSTPTLFNSGSVRNQMCSCYLQEVDDSIDGIFDGLWQGARKSKFAGGLGFHMGRIRGTNSYIAGTNGQSSGLIPWMKIYNDMLIACDQCFCAGTNVITENGYKAIENLSTQDRVLNSEGTFSNITKIWKNKNTKNIVNVKTKMSIKGIECTEDHLFYAFKFDKGSGWRDFIKKYNPQWIEAKKLDENHVTCLPIPQKVEDAKDLSYDDFRIYGLMLGDGSISKDRDEAKISFNREDVDQINFVKEYLNKRNIHFWENFSKETKLYQIGFSVFERSKVKQDPNTGKFVKNNRRGKQQFPFTQQDLYDKNRNKVIPEKFLYLPKEKTEAIVIGLIESDGCVNNRGHISFRNTSFNLINNLRFLLLRLGVISSCFEKLPSGGKFKGKKISWDLAFPVTSFLSKHFNVKEVSTKNWFVYDQKIWFRIKSVEKSDFNDTTYDISVDEYSSYALDSAYVHNSGRRKGSGCVYIEPWHIDIEEFLELRRNIGDDRRKCHDLNIALWNPDLFYERVEQEGQWTLFSPSDTPDLPDLNGKAFKKRYEEYEKLHADGEIPGKVIEAKALWKKTLKCLFETSHPWQTFKDPSQIRYPNNHVGLPHGSNLCTEVVLRTKHSEYSQGEKTEVGITSVCVLSSVCLPAHMEKQKDGKWIINYNDLASSVRKIIRALDNAIEVGFYPTEESKQGAMLDRPIGLGTIGWANVFARLGIPQDSDEAVKFSSELMEFISFNAIDESILLAEERGAYPTYDGSDWSKGILPYDTYHMMCIETGRKPLDIQPSQKNWDTIRERLKTHGIRNSTLMAIAPNASLAYLLGYEQSIEPFFSVIFRYENKSGNCFIVNEDIIDMMKSDGIWSLELAEALKEVRGDVLRLSLPDKYHKLFKRAFDRDQLKLIECTAARQIWIDQGISFNLYNGNTSLKFLNDIYMHSWKMGLKSTYYLRNKPANEIDMNIPENEKVQVLTDQQVCSINDPENCEMCEG
jgi:ribonucleoside-diphosphate reductase alpha chain